MIYRTMGRTRVEVSQVSLGLEHLEFADYATTDQVVSRAMEYGVNYMDLFMATPAVRDHIGRTLDGRRARMMVGGHLGSGLTPDGQYTRLRRVEQAVEHVEDLLTRLRTDYIDVLLIHFVDEMDDLTDIWENGLMEAAQRLKQQGKARFIGMSSHAPDVSLRAVESGMLDVLMFPVNPATDALRDHLSVEQQLDAPHLDYGGNVGMAPVRKQLYHACERMGTAIVAMKPYYAGWLLGDKSPLGKPMTPVQCLSYALSQPGVACAVPGCRTVEQLDAAMAYLEASEEERDYSALLSSSNLWQLEGACAYCNHCLPCPAHIDIAAVTRLRDAALGGVTEELTMRYAKLANGGGACLDCGACARRCPFGVDAPANMRQAAELFGR